ncbi:MAG: glucose 1-dehydrogenase [Acetobacteraceae bacterium]|nr:glucose 1-dehydrogenase [Acetobacteraceae bacterium]
MDFSGKVALVTGGGGGIGLATCLGFGRAGARVVVVDHDAALGQDAADQVKAAGGAAIFVRADVSKSAEVQAYVKAALDAYGRIDCFFNNAGIEGRVAPITEYDEEIWHAVIAVNLTGVFLGLKYVLPTMLKQGSGAVVNTASTAALFGAPGMAAYVAAKHGVAGITKVASSDVARYGVRVNAICPGPVETRMMRSLEAQRNPADPEAVHAANAAGMPTGRYSSAEEVANTVLYLCSELSANITGTQLVIDSGRSASGGAAIAPRRNV